MKKIIWIAFAALAALWTGFVALTLQLANWVLSLIAGSQVPGAAALGTAQWNPPAWAAPWVDPSWLKGLQESLVWAVQGLEPDPARGRRPGHLDLGAGLDLLGCHHGRAAGAGADPALAGRQAPAGRTGRRPSGGIMPWLAVARRRRGHALAADRKR